MILFMVSSIIAIAVPMMVFMISYLTSMKTFSNREKSSPFECGFDPNHNARIPFSLRFFLLAIIFIVFDIEIVLLVPIPILSTTMSLSSLMINTTTFTIILILGLLHEWNEGSLNWTN